MKRTLLALVASALCITCMTGCPPNDSKSGSGGSVSSSSSNAAPSGTYAWSAPEMTISIAFLGDGKCTMSMIEGGSTEDNEAQYTVNADTVVVQTNTPGSMPLTLKRRPDGNYDSNFMGMEAVFVKQ